MHAIESRVGNANTTLPPAFHPILGHLPPTACGSVSQPAMQPTRLPQKASQKMRHAYSSRAAILWHGNTVARQADSIALEINDRESHRGMQCMHGQLILHPSTRQHLSSESSLVLHTSGTLRVHISTW
jgi:hypothetical protein